MPADQFTTEMLVGNAKSAFVSQVSGNGMPATATSSSGSPGMPSIQDLLSGKSGVQKKTKN